jgi:hypothetical protein
MYDDRETGALKGPFAVVATEDAIGAVRGVLGFLDHGSAQRLVDGLAKQGFQLVQAPKQALNT